MMIDTIMNEIKSVWNAYEEYTDTKEGFRHNPIDEQIKYSVHCGFSFPDNKKSLLIGFPNAIENRTLVYPHGKGFSVSQIRTETLSTNYDWITIVCDDIEYDDIFISMVHDILTVIDNHLERNNGVVLLRLVIDRIYAWQRFLGKAKVLILTKEQEIGLWGELYVLNQLIDMGVSPGLLCKVWKGPERYSQDFLHETIAIEVKTCTHKLLNQVRISSLEQLDSSVFQKLFLICNQLDVDASLGKDLPSLIVEIQEKILNDAQKMQFHNKLIEYGFIDEYSTFYESPYVVQNQLLIRINESFPNITPLNVAREVTSVTYTLDLSGYSSNISLQDIFVCMEQKYDN